MKQSICVIPSLLLLTACGGGNVVLNTINLSEAPAGSVQVKSGDTVGAGSVDELLAIDLESSEVGSIIEVTDGDLAGIEIEVAEDTAGYTTLNLSGTNGDGAGNASLLVTNNPGLFIKAQSNLADVEGETVSQRSKVFNGTEVTNYENVREGGSTFISEGGLAIGSGSGSGGIVAQVNQVAIGMEAAGSLGYSRISEDAYVPQTSGTYIFEGPTVVFADENSYTDETSTMVLNFSELTGTYQANNFDPDMDAPDVNIVISSDLSIDNTDGSISGTGGTLVAGGNTAELSMVGILSTNNDAAAGAVIVNEDTNQTEIFGGLFALPKKP